MPTVHNINVVSGIPKGLDPGKGHGISNPDGQFFNQRDRGGAGGMGIYNGRGPFDVVAEEDWEDHLARIDPEDEMSEEEYFIAVGINRKTGPSGFQSANDSRPHYDKFSAVPNAAGSGHTALAANNNIEGSLIFEEFLKEYIFEVLNENGGSSMSVNYHLNKAGHSGKLHPPGSVGPPLSPGGGRSFNVRRITQSGNRKNRVSYDKTTSSGVQAMKNFHNPDELLTNIEEFENDKEEVNTTFLASNIFFDDEGKVYKDEVNVSGYNPYVKV
jgi:hypothetical protein